MKRQSRNLPLDFWNQTEGRKMRLNASCARLPGVRGVYYENDHWQMLQTDTDGQVFFLAAYYDNRSSPALVRSLIMVHNAKYTSRLHCQLWYNSTEQPTIVPVTDTMLIWRYARAKPGRQGPVPYLLACEVPAEDSRVPDAVSVVQQPCQTSSVLLPVVNNRPPEGQKPQDFAVCTKAFAYLFNDYSARLAEWLEMLRILGAKKVFIYEYQFHPNMSKVLQYYQQQGLVELTPISLVGGYPNLSVLRNIFFSSASMWLHEVVPYHDCLYRNLYRYDYIVQIDTDEIIMPKIHKDWPEMFEALLPLTDNFTNRTGKVPSHFPVKNVYFLDNQSYPAPYSDIPAYMHMLQNVRRSPFYRSDNNAPKTILRTSRTLTVDNHQVVSCGEPCAAYGLPIEVAQVHHYRSNCKPALSKVCDDKYRRAATLDTTAWRYKDLLISRVTDSLHTLGLI